VPDEIPEAKEAQKSAARDAEVIVPVVSVKRVEIRERYVSSDLCCFARVNNALDTLSMRQRDSEEKLADEGLLMLTSGLGKAKRRSIKADSKLDWKDSEQQVKNLERNGITMEIRGLDGHFTQYLIKARDTLLKSVGKIFCIACNEQSNASHAESEREDNLSGDDILEINGIQDNATCFPRAPEPISQATLNLDSAK